MARPAPLTVHVRPVRLPEPLGALGRLADRPGVFFRHAGSGGYRGIPFSFLASDPVEVLRHVRPTGTRSLATLLGPLRPGRVVRDGPRIPFSGGWAGMIGYEARAGVEATPPARRPPRSFPAIWLGRYDAVLAWNHRTRRSFVAGVGRSPTAAGRAADRLLGRLARRTRSAGREVGTRTPRARSTRDAYCEDVRASVEAIREGELFQVNVSHRFDARYAGRAVDLFRRLAEVQPAPYMTFLDLGKGRAVLSASPERFVRLVGRVAETDPMKGTRPRGRTRTDDRRLREELAHCDKEKAELAMIVDLSRNDLSRACDPGTVRVVTPRRLIAYPGVHQAIGVVRGRLERGLDRVDLLQAMFPPGSVTGAPKVRAMEILDALEDEGRGPYCGALGFFDENGDMDLSVAIRTIALAGRTASYRVGGGITLRSEPHKEWEETLAKGRGLFAALAGEASPS